MDYFADNWRWSSNFGYGYDIFEQTQKYHNLHYPINAVRCDPRRDYHYRSAAIGYPKAPMGQAYPRASYPKLVKAPAAAEAPAAASVDYTALYIALAILVVIVLWKFMSREERF